MWTRIVSMVLAGITLATGVKAADYVRVPMQIGVNVSAATAWKRVGGFCDISAWLFTSCVVTSGDGGEIGAIRRVADRVEELQVARTALSFTYSQPKSPIDYHGTVEVRADGTDRSEIFYTVIYDNDALGANVDRAGYRAGLESTLSQVVKIMKLIAEQQ
jgi:hypothetical protein